MKENEVYVTDKGVFVGIRSISGKSLFVKVVNVRDGEVKSQNKEMVLVDESAGLVRDPLYSSQVRLTAATPEQVEEFHRLENVTKAVSEDKRTTGARDDLTGTNSSGLRRI
jgi:hypothetical protein